MEQTIQNIPLTKISTSPLNPRKTFDQAGIEELAENIKRQGLLQPITVRPIEYSDELTDGEVVSIPVKYEIVCGERRYRAVTLTGSETIPCIVREMTDDEAFDAMITENLQRKDVDPIEEAFAFRQLCNRGNNVEEIAARFGKSVKFIRERIKLDELLPEMKEWVSKGLMHIGAAIHIAKLTEEDQRKFFEDFEPDEDDDMEDLEPISKDDAVEFTNNLFKRIANAYWDEDFEGPCKCVCDKCQFNDANDGCLFNDMKVDRDHACCTNHERWTAKRLAWCKNLVDQHANNLVKSDEDLAPGKMVLAYGDTYYKDAVDYTALKDYCTWRGYKMTSIDMFERWKNLSRDDEATRKKLVNGEAYIVVFISSDYNGVNVNLRCHELKKAEAKESAETAKVAQLVRDYEANINKSQGDIANEMRKAVGDFDLNSINWKAFTDVEWEIMLALLIQSSPYNVKDAIMGQSTRDEAEFVKEHNTAEGRDDILRKWLRGKLSDSSVTYYPILQKCQARLIEVWGIDDVEVKARAATKLRKKQDKIEKELLKLGYGTDGKRLDF